MRRLILALLILIVSMWVGLKIAQDPGMAYFTYQHWSVEMPLWLAALGLLMVCYLVYLLSQFVHTLGFSWYRFKNWLRWRRGFQAVSKTQRGVLELLEGDWSTAENYLLQGVTQSEAPLINYLAAAKAAHEQEHYATRDQYLHKALILAPQADAAIALTKAQLHLEKAQWEEALASLAALRQRAPRHPFMLRLLRSVYFRLGEWRELLKLSPYLRKAGVIDKEAQRDLETRIYCEILQGPLSAEDGYLSLQHRWDCIPRALRTNPDLVMAYAERLMSFPEGYNELAALMNTTIKKHPHAGLLKLFGAMVHPDPKKALNVAEHWPQPGPYPALLFLTLGRLAVRCQLWGKARQYFEMSLERNPMPETYAEYGALLEQLHETDGALQSYKLGLLLRI